MWFAQTEACAPPRPSNAFQRHPLSRIASTSLDNVLQAREEGFGEVKRMVRRSANYGLQCEGEERKREMLALMPTDLPSTDPMESDNEEGEDEQISEDEENIAPGPSRRGLGFRQPSAITGLRQTAQLGRATSLDIIASSSRAKRLVLHGPRSVSGPAIPSDLIFRPDKRDCSDLQASSEYPKRTRRDSQNASSSLSKPCLRQHDTFDPSQSASDLMAPPTAQVGPPDLPRSLSHSDRHGSTSTRPNPCFRHHDSFDRSQSTQSDMEAGPPPTPLIGTPGLTRSFSFSSPASIFSVAEAPFHGRLDIHSGRTVHTRASTIDIRRYEREAEIDTDVLSAATQLVQFRVEAEVGMSRV